MFQRNCCSCFLLFYSFKLLAMHFNSWWYKLYSMIIYSLGGLEHSDHGDMVYCIGNAEYLIYICLIQICVVVVYIHKIGHDVGLWGSNVLPVSPTSIHIPCDLIILGCIWEKNPSFFNIYLTRTILIFTSSLRPSAILVPFVAQYLQIEHVAQITNMYPKTTQLAWF